MSDYASVNEQLLPILEGLLYEMFPEGKITNGEFHIGNIQGDPGESLSVNLKSGKWSDFAMSEEEKMKGHDFIALYAKKFGISNPEALKLLMEKYNLSKAIIPRPKQNVIGSDGALGPAPDDAPPPNQSPETTGMWFYENKDGHRLYYVLRHDRYDEDGVLTKSYSQRSWNTAQKRWVGHSYPAPRPLYKLCTLLANPLAKVLLVEGEKAAEAAQKMVGERAIVTTWSGGAGGINKVDWKTLAKRQVTIWPDADQAGVECAISIANKLHALGAEVQVIDVSTVPKSKWDAADALAEGWDYQRLSQWATEHARPIQIDDGNNIVATGSQIERWRAMGLQQNSRGTPVMNMVNVSRVLEANAGTLLPKVWYDTFMQRKMVDYGQGPQKYHDADGRRILKVLQSEQLGLSTLGWDVFNHGLNEYAESRLQNCILDEVKKYKSTLPPGSLETFFTQVGGAPDNEYTRAVSKNFWLSMMMRIIRPGCKVDSMFILEGKQGIGKSKLLHAIGGDYYVELGFSKFDKANLAVTMQGHFIAELGELTQFRKADVAELKSWISCTHDEIRRAYDREASSMPRQCILVGTTNQSTYLNDNTGARRFFPVTLPKKIDFDYFNAARESLFAEAYTRCLANECWWDFAEVSVEEQESRRIADAWEDTVCALEEPEISVREVAVKLGITEDRLDRGVQLRIAECLRTAGYENSVVRRGNQILRRWVKKSVDFEE